MARVKLIDTSKPVYAVKKFSMGKASYLTGEEVDLTDVSERMLQRLVKFRFITETKPGVSTQAVAPGGMTSPSKQPLSVEPTVETVTEEPSVEIASDDKAVKLNHVGGGYYEAVGVDGENILPEKVQGKDNAKMIAENLGFTVA